MTEGAVTITNCSSAGTDPAWGMLLIPKKGSKGLVTPTRELNQQINQRDTTNIISLTAKIALILGEEFTEF